MLSFVKEKAAYKGPWSVPKRRAKKHPLAPKRPMSAFLKYSQTRRATVKQDNPDMSNTDVSRLLGEMWRNANPKERAPYVEQEERERSIYKEVIKKFRDDQTRMDAASRTSHHSVQNYRHHPQGGGSFDRSYTNVSGSFENLNLDSFEEPAKKASYRPQYSNQHAYSMPSYRQPYPSAPGRLLPFRHLLRPAAFYSIANVVFFFLEQISRCSTARNIWRVIHYQCLDHLCHLHKWTKTSPSVDTTRVTGAPISQTT
jgi:hypothetical protein